MDKPDRNVIHKSIPQQAATPDSPQPGPTWSIRRRNLLTAGVGLTAAALMLRGTPLLASPASEPVSTAAVNAEIAFLGDAVRREHPALAVDIEQWARGLADLPGDGMVSWTDAERARAILVSADRVSAELQAADVLFVTGWLLSRSEAAAAILYSSAAASGAAPSAGNAAG